jgi:hypothetical protein
MKKRCTVKKVSDFPAVSKGRHKENEEEMH